MEIEIYEADQRLTLLASTDARLAREDEAERAWNDMLNLAMRTEA
jgi:hypothetical protein